MTQQTNTTIAGVSVPTFFYGTAWKEAATEACVSAALQAGFRAIDTANQRKHYHEVGVGDALLHAYEKGELARADLFLQTKFTHRAGQDHRLPYDESADMHTQVLQSFESSLQHLHTDYLDSYVLHGPSTRPGLADEDWEVWRAMEELHASGKVKLLGVSNVVLNQLKEFYEEGKVKPSFVQNRCFANTRWDKEVRDFCNQHDIRYQGFSLLTANTWVAEHPRFQEIARRYACSAAQLIFCFALEARMIPLTGTTTLAHMQHDLAVYNLKLSAEDTRIIEYIVEG